MAALTGVFERDQQPLLDSLSVSPLMVSATVLVVWRREGDSSRCRLVVAQPIVGSPIGSAIVGGAVVGGSVVGGGVVGGSVVGGGVVGGSVVDGSGVGGSGAWRRSGESLRSWRIGLGGRWLHGRRIRPAWGRTG